MSMGRILKAFTIIELLIVIVIIGVLVAISAVAYTGVTNQAKAAKAGIDLANTKKSLDIYRIKQGKIPTNEQDMSNTLKHLEVIRYGGVYDKVSVARGEYLVDYRNYGGNDDEFDISFWDYQENRWRGERYRWRTDGSFTTSSLDLGNCPDLNMNTCRFPG